MNTVLTMFETEFILSWLDIYGMNLKVTNFSDVLKTQLLNMSVQQSSDVASSKNQQQPPLLPASKASTR